MARLLHTLLALDDISDIYAYIAQENVTAAEKMVRRFDEIAWMLADNPLLGERADRYRSGLYQFSVGKYVLFYMPIEGGIEVQRILHGARKLEDLL